MSPWRWPKPGAHLMCLAGRWKLHAEVTSTPRMLKPSPSHAPGLLELVGVPLYRSHSTATSWVSHLPAWASMEAKAFRAGKRTSSGFRR